MQLPSTEPAPDWRPLSEMWRVTAGWRNTEPGISTQSREMTDSGGQGCQRPQSWGEMQAWPAEPVLEATPQPEGHQTGQQAGARERKERSVVL